MSSTATVMDSQRKKERKIKVRVDNVKSRGENFNSQL